MKTLSGKLIGIVLACTAAVLCMGFIPVYAAAETIAQFSFTGGSSETDFSDVTPQYGNKTDGYSASAGVLNGSAKLFASVEGGDTLRGLEWSKDEYVNPGTYVPVMTANTTKFWGDEPYFLIKASTAGYENITFSAELGGTNKGPRDWRLEVSTNGGVSYTAVKDISLSTNKTMLKVFDNTALSGSENKSEIYIRMIASSTTNIGGNDFTKKDYRDGGEAAVNNVVISGTKILPVLSAPTFSKASGTTVTVSDTLAITSVTGAAIWYKINNGTEQKYTGPISFAGMGGQTVSVTARAVYTGVYQDSPSVTNTYTVQLPVLSAPTFSKASGATVTVSDTLMITSVTGAAIWYKINNGTEQKYTGPISFAGMGGQTVSVTARAVYTGVYQDSPSVTNTYTVEKPALSAPTASISNGSSVTVSESLTLTAPDGAAISYTVNGGQVQSYTQPITPFEGQGGKTVTISVTASKSGYIDSTASFVYYVALENLDAPVISGIGDTVTVDTLINVTAKQGAVIKYTVNGGAEQIYDSTVKIFAGLGGRTADVKLWAEMEGHSNSPYTEVTYTVLTDLTVLTDDVTLKTGTAYKIRYSCAVDNAVVMAGFYNADGDLVQCLINPEEITIPSDSGITRVDVMLWHSLISMKPVTSKVVKAVE